MKTLTDSGPVDYPVLAFREIGCKDSLHELDSQARQVKEKGC